MPQPQAEIGAVLRSALVEPHPERLRRLEDAGVIGDEAEQRADQQQLQRMTGVAACLEQVVQLPHLLRGADVDGVLRHDLLRAVTGDEAEVPDLVVQLGEFEFDGRVRVEVVQPEAREIRDQDVARHVALGEALEDRDAPAFDPEDVEKTVAEALRLGALGAFAFPFAREGERARFDLVPGKRHLRRWAAIDGDGRRTGSLSDLGVRKRNDGRARTDFDDFDAPIGNR